VPKDKLKNVKNADGFDKNNWPDRVDPTWSKTL